MEQYEALRGRTGLRQELITPEVLKLINPTGDQANCVDANIALWRTLDGTPRPAGTTLGDSRAEHGAIWEFGKRWGWPQYLGTGPNALARAVELVGNGVPDTRALLFTVIPEEIGHAVTLLNVADRGILGIDPQRHVVENVASLPNDIPDNTELWAYIQSPKGNQVVSQGGYGRSGVELTDPELLFGGTGSELEDHQYRLIFPSKIKIPDSAILATSEYLKLVTDYTIDVGTGEAFPIIEYVTAPTKNVPGDEGRPDRESVMRQLRDVRGRIFGETSSGRGYGTGAEGIPLAEVLRPFGFKVTDLGRRTKIKRVNIGKEDATGLVHFTVMAAPSRTYKMLQHINTRARTSNATYQAAKQHLVQGFRLGNQHAAVFAQRRLLSWPKEIPPYLMELLTAHEDIQMILGHSALIYQQFAGGVHARFKQDALEKHFSIAISRTSNWGIRKELTDAVQEFYHENYDEFAGQASDSLNRVLGLGWPPMEAALGPHSGRLSFGDYLKQAWRIIEKPSTVISQERSHFVRTNFLLADSNPKKGLFGISGKARLSPAVTLLEIRSVDPEWMTHDQFEEDYIEWERISTQHYREAQQIRSGEYGDLARSQLDKLRMVLELDATKSVGGLLAVFNEIWAAEERIQAADGLVTMGVVVPIIEGVLELYYRRNDPDILRAALEAVRKLSAHLAGSAAQSYGQRFITFFQGVTVELTKRLPASDLAAPAPNP